MIVSATEFKTNFGKYLSSAKVINPQISAADSLRGILKNAPDNLDLNSAREERLTKYENHV